MPQHFEQWPAGDCEKNHKFNLIAFYMVIRFLRRSNTRFSNPNANQQRIWLRLEDRRRPGGHPAGFRARMVSKKPGCRIQLGTQELALADAYGPGLLRHRIDGCGRESLRYFAVRL